MTEVAEETIWPTLRAMSENYTPGWHTWDSLDSEACKKGAEEIKALREELSSKPSEEVIENAARWLWLWNRAENVSFSYRVDQYTRASVMGLHCGTLKDAVDSARKFKKES